MATATGDGVTSGSLSRRPSAFETIFWLMTARSPGTSGVDWRAAAASTSAATSSPGRTSAIPSMPKTS